MSSFLNQLSAEALALDDAAWELRFAQESDVFLRMAEQAIEEDERGETLP